MTHTLTPADTCPACAPLLHAVYKDHMAVFPPAPARYYPLRPTCELCGEKDYGDGVLTHRPNCPIWKEEKGLDLA